ncbi:MAG: methyltransferase domain-containing protein [Streptosporangiales bacterium]|nr:methyltransferase domain-containing protein [Streptosporangiales bacterium]
MAQPVREFARGDGPGVITPDGCAVEFYSLLHAEGEPEIVHRAAGDGASILELGCGAGRMTHPLIDLGHAVTAVDESPEMLEKVHGATKVRSSIENLHLSRRFDAVLLASQLVNVPDDALRRELLAACRRHVRDGGHVIVQRSPASWFDVKPRTRIRGGIAYRIAELEPLDGGRMKMTMIYTVGDRSWTHAFTTRVLEDPELETELKSTGLTLEEYLTPDHSWLSARPI